MKNIIKYLLVLIALLAWADSYSQDVPLTSWKDYLSYRNGVNLTKGIVNNHEVVYCVAGSGLFSYNTGDNSLEKLSKVTGLSDISPTVARFSQKYNVLVIGYSDGNIDLMQNNNIVNIPALYSFSAQGSKTINCICFDSIYAYIGCGQGIMQFDLTQDVVSNTFIFGALGSPINVRSIAVLNDTIFAGTDYGVYMGNLDTNLNDYTTWHVAPFAQVPWGKYNTMVKMGDSVYANWSSSLTTYAAGYDTTSVYSKGHWSRYNNLLNTSVNSLETTQINGRNALIVSTAYTINSFYPDGSSAFPQQGTYVLNGKGVRIQASDAITDGNGTYWVADDSLGLVKATGIYFSASQLTPQGPYNNLSFAMAVNNNNIWIVAGGYDANLAPLSYGTGLSTEQNQSWGYIPSPDTVVALNCIAVDPFNPLHVFAGSWGVGLVEYNNNAIVNVWNGSNSPIQYYVGAPGTYRVGGIAFDTLGNLWVTNSNAASKYLEVKKANGIWDSIDFKSLTTLQPVANLTSVIVTQSQAKWLLFGGTGIVAYQDNGTFAVPNASNTELITNQVHHGGLPDLNINCMTEDQNGSIWVGTDAQVMVFYSPDNVFDGAGDWDAEPVYVTQNGYTQYLMQNQNTTTIAIDGANRKWIGTGGGGVFLMSADGTQQIYNFTTSNSPLLSNNIQQIVINPDNGEVFFATDKGVVSFRGTATEGGNSFSNVYAFPDPVPHDYSGPIAIKNLVTNADVKITTVSGQLVYHTIALGGQAIWNGTNFEGKRVQTGVYMVYCTSPDGSQNLVSKLLFIN